MSMIKITKKILVGLLLSVIVLISITP
ncbi:MAG: hypothetical protein K0S04_3935, partial [Herbinix sp.]|nr:hypothetical protein [Herbinix sp.]